MTTMRRRSSRSSRRFVLAAVGAFLACVGCAERPDTSLGDLVWSADLGAEVVATPLALEPVGPIVVPTAEGFLFGLDPGDGRALWRSRLAGPSFSSPRAAGGLVFVGDNGGVCRAVDPADGSTRWSFAAGHWVLGSPVPAGRLVLVPSLDHRLYALDRATGERVWSFETGAPIYGAPAADGDQVYVGSLDGRLYALDAASGALLWKRETGSWVVAEPSVLGETVVFASDDRKVYCVGKADGVLMWEFTVAPQRISYTEVHKDRARIAHPIAGDGVVFVASMNRRLYAIEAGTGRLVWGRAIEAPVWGSPTLWGGALWVGDLAGSLSRIDPVSGDVLARARISRPWNPLLSQSSRDWSGDNLWASPLFTGDKLIVASADHRVLCFRVR